MSSPRAIAVEPTSLRAEVIGVPKWFMVATMSTVLAGTATASFGGVKFYAQSAVMADRLERLETKVDKLDTTLLGAAADRWTGTSQKAHEADVRERLAAHEHRHSAELVALEARITARIERLERERK